MGSDHIREASRHPRAYCVMGKGEGGRVVASRPGTHAPKSEAMLVSPVNVGPRGVVAQYRGWRRLEHADKTHYRPGARARALLQK